MITQQQAFNLKPTIPWSVTQAEDGPNMNLLIAQIQGNSMNVVRDLLRLMSDAVADAEESAVGGRMKLLDDEFKALQAAANQGGFLDKLGAFGKVLNYFATAFAFAAVIIAPSPLTVAALAVTIVTLANTMQTEITGSAGFLDEGIGKLAELFESMGLESQAAEILATVSVMVVIAAVSFGGAKWAGVGSSASKAATGAASAASQGSSSAQQFMKALKDLAHAFKTGTLPEAQISKLQNYVGLMTIAFEAIQQANIVQASFQEVRAIRADLKRNISNNHVDYENQHIDDLKSMFEQYLNVNRQIHTNNPGL